MLELDDNVLLREYVEHGSEEAFATLVARHVNKVYSIALRHARNPHHAEEITQAVFVILARKSRQLGKRVILSGWLCRTARLSAVTFIRSEIRRTRREQEAHMQNLLNESEAEIWPQIAPLMDAAMAGLSEADHDAVVLRFFDGKSMKEIGAALGASEDAAKMRVNRAVEKLRIFFIRRGIICSAAALTAAISANSVHAAPIGLAATISTATALVGTTTTVTGAKLVIMTTLQKVLAVSVLAVALGFGTHKVVRISVFPEKGAAAQPSPVATDTAPALANGMITTASGLKYQVLKRGTGTMSPQSGDKVRVHYHGVLLDGTVFDSSVERGEPKIFPVDSVIAGWTEGIQLMKVGDMFKFEIPPHLGYGVAKSKNANIPPNSTLVFEVELLGIQ